MTKGKIGLNAGTLWNLLPVGIQVSAEDLQKRSLLPNIEFWAAVGWLARENKVEIVEERNSLLICSGTNFYF